MDFELDLQGRTHRNCMVLGSYPFHFIVCHYGNGDGESIMPPLEKGGAKS